MRWRRWRRLRRQQGQRRSTWCRGRYRCRRRADGVGRSGWRRQRGPQQQWRRVGGCHGWSERKRPRTGMAQCRPARFRSAFQQPKNAENHKAGRSGRESSGGVAVVGGRVKIDKTRWSGDRKKRACGFSQGTIAFRWQKPLNYENRPALPPSKSSAWWRRPGEACLQRRKLIGTPLCRRLQMARRERVRVPIVGSCGPWIKCAQKLASLESMDVCLRTCSWCKATSRSLPQRRV